MLSGTGRVLHRTSIVAATYLDRCRGFAWTNSCQGRRSVNTSAIRRPFETGLNRVSGSRSACHHMSPQRLDWRHMSRKTKAYAVDNAKKEAAFATTESELQGHVERKMTEVYKQIDASVNSGGGNQSLAGLSEESKSLYNRLDEAIVSCQSGLIERDIEVRLMLLAALSGEHILFIGPPGTAKSELGRRLSRLYKGAFFERLLTRFSVPEELFGPLSMAALEDDKYVRQTSGYLPTASVAFIDEIFKANSAILNTLLTVLNERLFDNGTERTQVPLICLVGASNELPESEELDALYDRFLVRREVKQVSQAGLYDLLRTPDTSPNAAPTSSDGGDSGAAQSASAPPGSELASNGDALVTAEDFRDIRLLAAKEVTVPNKVQDLLVGLREMLQQTMEPAVYVSDRRLLKAISLLKVSAFTNGRREVTIEDCMLLQHLMWQKPLEAERIGDWLLEQLATGSEVRQCKALLSSLFSRTIKGMSDESISKSLAREATELRKVLASKLTEVRCASGGALPRLTGHLWLGKADADAAATSLAPKLRTSRDEVASLLSDAVSLEVCLTENATAVPTASLLPVLWAEFISGGKSSKM